jgi:hypothetical protein
MTSPTNNADDFRARPTTRLGRDHKIEADGDTWQELMAVCEAESGGESGNLAIRSYYQNDRTNERVWDEPPSGATRIVPANEEMRRMAQMQLNEMHLIVPDKKEKKKKGLLKKVFGKKKKQNEGDPKELPKIQYKPNSQMYAKRALQDTEEGLIEAAIIASITECQDGTLSHTQGMTKEEEEQLAMATALSMSEVQGASEDQHQSEERESEEEMLARVMEQSKIETKVKRDPDLLGLEGPVPNFQVSPSSSSGYPHQRSEVALDDRKMPALPSSLKVVSTDAAGLLPPTRMMAHISDSYTSASSTLSTSYAPPAPPAMNSTPHVTESNNSTSPVALFDPYARGTMATGSKLPTQPEPVHRDASSLQKMDGQPSQRPFFKTRRASSSVKKMKDKAGLV